MSAGTDAGRLWVFDFDGTLSPIVAERAAAQLPPAARALLRDLATEPSNRVAVLSTRALDDLAARVPVPGVILGGSSGLEWRLPGGRRIHPGAAVERRLEDARRRVRPTLDRIAAAPGVEIEDKRWSVAVHYRGVSPDAMPSLVPLLDALDRLPGIRAYAGPMAVEVQLIPSIDKAFGLRLLCRALGFDAGKGRVFYAGDDENDAAAMRWTLARNGTVFAVGTRLRIPGALSVAGLPALVRAVRAQTGAPAGPRTAGDGKETPG